ncbi:hypothetical protein XENTR_v10010697 [Xenopus tropicalis]|nr:hypothetical protein XENTR_v10010697 [Xenopus tropicalis]
MISRVRKRLKKDTALNSRTKLNPEQVCSLLGLCLNTTYFKHNGVFYGQKHGGVMGFPVSPVLLNCYMEEVEKKALGTFKGTERAVLAVWFPPPFGT